MTALLHRPDGTETAEYDFAYIDQVASDDIQCVLASQATEAIALLKAICD